MSNTGLFFLIMGPSGVGKGTVMQMLRERHPEFVFPRSMTTRPPRPGEQEGVMYFFVSDEDFDVAIAQEQLLEWAVVHQYQRYGVLRSEVEGPLEQGKVVVREVDVAGWRTIMESSLRDRVVSVFIMPPSPEALKERILKRSPVGEAELAARLLDVALETEAGRSCDYHVVSHENRQDEVYREVEAAIVAEMRKNGLQTGGG